MSFRLKLNEPLQKCVRRISSEQFDIASRELAAIAIMPDGVHQTRKVLKRLRALLRLIGPSIGARRQKAHNVQLRDIGRMLAGRREQAVLIETLSALAARAEPEATAVIEGYRDRLRAPHLDLAGSLDSDLAGRSKQRRFPSSRSKARALTRSNRVWLRRTVRDVRLSISRMRTRTTTISTSCERWCRRIGVI